MAMVSSYWLPFGFNVPLSPRAIISDRDFPPRTSVPLDTAY